MALPQIPYLAAFVVGGALSVGLAGWWGGVTTVFSGLLTTTSMFIVGCVGFRSVAEFRRLCLLLVLAGAVMTIHGHFQVRDGVGWTGLPLILGRITYSGIFSDPNDLGQFLVVAAAAAVFLFNTAGSLGRILVVLALVCLAYGVLLTDSRGSLLAGVVVALFAFSLRYGRVIGLTALALAVPALLVSTRLAELTPKEQSANDRVEAWYAGIQMWLSNPIWGVGLGNFTDHHHLTAHSVLVLPMAEGGLIGFIPWFGYVLLTGYMAMHLWRAGAPRSVGREASDVELAASRSAALMALAWAVTGLFLSRSYSPILFLLGGIVAGRYLGAAEVMGVGASAWPRPPTLSKVIAATVFAMFVIWAAVKLLIWWRT
jgi:O-antigen ligase